MQLTLPPRLPASRLKHLLLEGRWLGLPIPILFVLAYFALQAVLLTWTRQGASFDGAEQLVTAQAFEWGYGRSQPPVYTWLLLALSPLVPQPLAAEHILKALLFATGFSAIFLTARRIGLSRPAAALAMLLTFLLPEIGWQAQTAYSHSTLVFASGALLLLSFVHLTDKSSAAAHALFGALAGLALLSKFSAGFLILAMVAALLYEGQLRAVFGRVQALAGLAALLAVVGPHAIWSLQNLELLFALRNRFAIGAYANPFAARGAGLLTYIASAATFIGPLLLVFLATVAPRTARLRPATQGERRIGATFVAALPIMALVPILSGATDFAPRWPLAALFFYGLIAASFVDRIRPERVERLALFAAAVALAFLVGINLRSSLPNSRFQNDYPHLLAQIEAEAGPLSSVMISDYPVLANLRIARPTLHLVMREFPFTRRYLDPDTVFLWTGEAGMPDALAQANRELGREPSNLRVAQFEMRDSYGNPSSTSVHAAWWPAR